MRALENRLKRLVSLRDAKHKEETPWWTLPPDVEPDWERPLIHLRSGQIDRLRYKEIEDYCDAQEAGREYRQSPQEVYIGQEAFHEIRWRRHGIARRSSGMPEPPSWREVLNEKLANLELTCN